MSTSFLGRLAFALGLAACGSSDPAATDAAPPDAPPIDAAPPDAVQPDADSRALPDLTISLDRAIADVALRRRTFADDACELDPDEACIEGPGDRTLLHFSVETPNVGNVDMVLGAPDPDNDQFSFSQCHMHYHFEGYAEYRLIDQAGGELATGRKQAFCLLDTGPYLPGEDVPAQAKYDCDFQGIQRGWSDVYHSRLPCQFIDVTDVPPGQYTLEIHINNGGTLPELTMDNNLVTVPIDLTSPDVSSPTETCPAALDPHATSTENRECGWDLVGTFDCTPGAQYHVGCASSCGVGSCTGDPMIRVCDAERPDGNCSYPAAVGISDDACGSACPLTTFTRCPPSGKLAAYAAPFTVGTDYTCTAAIDPAGG